MCTLWTNSSLRQDGQYDMITNLSIMHLYIHCTHDNLCNSHMKAITFMISQWKNTCVRTCTRTAQVVFVFLFNMTRLCTTRRMQSIVGRAQQVLHVCEACISLPLLAVSRNTILQHLDTRVCVCVCVSRNNVTQSLYFIVNHPLCSLFCH